MNKSRKEQVGTNNIMKKILLSTIMAFASLAIYAQSSVGSIKFTPSVGITVANVTNSESDYKVGFIAGADALYQVTDVIGLSGGLFYSQQGCKEEMEGITVSLANDYLNIPLMVNAYVAPNFALKLGIQPSILLSADIKAKSGLSVSVDAKDYYKSFDLSLPVGASYEFSNIVVDARYNIGLTNLLSDTPSSDNGKNSVFQFTVGYRF